MFSVDEKLVSEKFEIAAFVKEMNGEGMIAMTISPNCYSLTVSILYCLS